MVTAAAKSLQSCPALCDPVDYSPPAILSMGFSMREYWSRLPFSSSGYLPHLGIKPKSLKSPALAGRFFITSATWEYFTLIKKNIFLQLIYNFVLILLYSKVMVTNTLYMYIFFFIMVYYRILNIVPPDTQQDLVVYPSYI